MVRLLPSQGSACSQAKPTVRLLSSQHSPLATSSRMVRLPMQWLLASSQSPLAPKPPARLPVASGRNKPARRRGAHVPDSRVAVPRRRRMSHDLKGFQGSGPRSRASRWTAGARCFYLQPSRLMSHVSGNEQAGRDRLDRDDAQLVIGVADGHSGLRQPMWRFDPAIRLVGRRDVVGEAIQPQLHDVCACSSKTRGGIAAVLAGKEAP